MNSPEWISQQANQLREIAAKSEAMTGPELIAAAVSHCQSQQELSRLSGIAPNTLTTLKRGKAPTAAHRAAILWAITRTMGIA